MKILLVANINSSHTRKWALALVSRGIRVALFSIDPALDGAEWSKALDLVVYPDSKDKLLPRKYFRLLRSLKRTASIFQPDIVHSHFLTNYTFIVAYLALKPHVATAWGSDVYAFPREGFIQKTLLKYNLSKATALVSTSNNMAAEMKKYVNRDVHIIPFGIDFSLYSEPSENSDKSRINISCFKKIEKIYGYETLILAFQMLCLKFPELPLHLTIAGSGSMLNEIRTQASYLGVSSQITFTGWVDPSRVPAMLKKTDICVYLSRHESFGVSLLEAMASKIPLVVTDTPGFLEVVQNEDNALIVKVGDAIAAAEKMEKLITDPELGRRMAARAYQHAREHLELKDNIDKQIQLYNSLLNK
jgi:glycosyltransferase involved in cell wall biosynthesis